MHNIATNVIKVLLNKLFFRKKVEMKTKKQNCFKKKHLFLVGLNIYNDICVIKYIKCIRVLYCNIYKQLGNLNERESFIRLEDTKFKKTIFLFINFLSYEKKSISNPCIIARCICRH